MVVIFGKGNEFYIERVSVSIALVDAAGTITGGLTDLERPGFFLGGSIVWTSVVNNDNVQTIDF